MDAFVRMGWLLDYYGGLLTEHQRALMELHYGQDLSLGEIAQQRGISRQAVADVLGRAGQTLEDMEQKLGLAQRAMQTLAHARSAAAALERQGPDAAEKALGHIGDIMALWEDTHGI
nr:YlxM family DNA-binding protein [bacterium]